MYLTLWGLIVFSCSVTAPPLSNLSILSQEKALNEHISVGIDY